MKCSLLAAIVLTTVMHGALSAQTPAPTTPVLRLPSAAAQPATATPPMTLTGCLKPWDVSTMGPQPGPGGTVAPVPAVAGAPQQFVLTDAVAAAPAPTPTAPGAPVPPSGRATTTAGAHATHLLKASLFVDLASHANHQVQVTGSLTTEAAATWFGTPGAPPAAPGGAAPAASGTAAQPATVPSTFVVTSVTMIAKTCS